MTTTPEIVAFVRTGEVRPPKDGEWSFSGGDLWRSAGQAANAYPIFLPIPATHPKAADILALVPRPKTLGERCVDALYEHRHAQGGVSRATGDELVMIKREYAAIIDRLAAEGK